MASKRMFQVDDENVILLQHISREPNNRNGEVAEGK
jgi:hypothetical protein